MNRGLSLAETLISIAILALALLTLLSIAEAAISAQDRTRKTSHGVAVANTELEKWVLGAQKNRHGTYNDLWGPVIAGAVDTGDVTVGRTTYNYFIYVTDASITDFQPNNQLRKVDIWVLWQGGARSGQGKLQARASMVVNQE